MKGENYNTDVSLTYAMHSEKASGWVIQRSSRTELLKRHINTPGAFRPATCHSTRHCHPVCCRCKISPSAILHFPSTLLGRRRCTVSFQLYAQHLAACLHQNNTITSAKHQQTSTGLETWWIRASHKSLHDCHNKMPKGEIGGSGWSCIYQTGTQWKLLINCLPVHQSQE